MSDSARDRPDDSEAARMQLGPDAIHEMDEELAIDCPQCGATVSILQIVNEGYCPGRLDAEETEVESDDTDPQEGECGAQLSLELVWEA